MLWCVICDIVVFRMRHVALAAFAFALVSAQELGNPCLEPPLGCGCAVLVTGGIEYTCSGFELIVLNSERKAVIKCSGKALDCSKLPQIPFGGNLQLDTIKLEDCSLDSSLECAMSKLNTTGAEQLMFERHRSPIVAENFRGLGALHHFMHYKSEAVTRISADTVELLPNLDNLQLVDAKVQLRSFSFANSSAEKLRRLEISMNDIPVLPADAFAGLNNLTVLSLFLNKIQAIDINAFRGLHSLQELSLNSNKISSLAVGLFQHTPQLSYLVMSRNADLLLEAGVFSGLDRLLNLELQGSNLVLRSRSLAGLPSLVDVDLSDAALTELPADVFHNSTAIVNLTLSYNKISVLPDTLFHDQKMLRKLDLSYNKLQSVSKNTFATLYNLTEIYMNNNDIKNLTEDLFSSISTLKTVSFAHNRIADINWYAFRSAGSVTSLDLSHNLISWSRSDDVHEDRYSVNVGCQSPLYSLNGLEYLNLSYNQINTVCYDWIQLMTYLKILDLAFNNITELSAADTNILSNATVDFRNNNITKITLNNFMVKQPDLRLGNNPYNCDCQLYDFLRQLDKLPHRVEDAVCNSPQSLKNIPLSSVAVDKLGDVICPLPESETPQGCTCISRPAMDRTECNCRRVQSNLPDPANSGLSSMLLKLTAQPKLKGLPSFVKTLNLAYLKLETVPDIPETVRHVDLSHNRLSRIPFDVLNRPNLTLELRNNSFNCDCEGAEDIANIQRVQKQIDEKITDYEMLVCTDGFRVEGVDPPRLCYLRDGTIIGASLAAIGIFLLVLGILYNKYSLQIKIWLFYHGWTWLIKEEMLDALKKYDIFLSFAHEDETFVIDKLLPELDNRYKVCVHTRDWNVGETIVEQIYRSVADSRRTLIVVSKAFLESMWSLEEFRAAYHQTVKDRRPRIVAVLLDDVKIDAAPELIKNYLNLTTYIEWKDGMFWEKLHVALPRKINADDVKKRKTTTNAVKNLAKGGLNVVCNEDGKLVNVADLKKQLDVILAPKIQENHIRITT